MRSPSAPFLAAALLASSLSGCRREPQPAPETAAQTPAPALTPLTSRQADGAATAAPPSSADHGAAPNGTLPPGHPPLDAAASGAPSLAADGPAITGTVEVAPA